MSHCSRVNIKRRMRNTNIKSSKSSPQVLLSHCGRVNIKRRIRNTNIKSSKFIKIITKGLVVTLQPGQHSLAEKRNGICNARQGFWNLWHSHPAGQLAHNGVRCGCTREQPMAAGPVAGLLNSSKKKKGCAKGEINDSTFTVHLLYSTLHYIMLHCIHTYQPKSIKLQGQKSW